MENWRKYIYYFDEEHFQSYNLTLKGMSEIISFNDKEILCLGSGTGYYPLSYLKLGAKHVTCLDISSDFLEIIKNKLSSSHTKYSTRITLINSSMTDFNLDTKFDYIFCNGDSFSCLLRQSEQIDCIKNINKHLKSSGKAYISAYLLSQRLNENFKSIYFFKDAKDIEIKETVTATIDYSKHILEFNYEWYDGSQTFLHNLPTRILTYPEMKLLFNAVDMKIKNSYGNNYSQTISDDNMEWIFEIQ